MKLPRYYPGKHRKGLAIIGLIILIAAVLIIAGSIIYMLYKVCKKCLPPPDNGGNHIVATVGEDTVSSYDAIPPIQLPDLKFPELSKPAGWTAEKPFGNGWMELQRSTNMVDWETILVSHDPSVVLSMDDDTNPPSDRAFYRGRFVYP